MRSRTLAQAKYDNVNHARLPLVKYVGLSPELNIDHTLAVMADYRWSRDWFFSCRWIPARIFRAQAMVNPSQRNEAIYAAHHKLMPSGEFEAHLSLNAAEYRRQYQEILNDHKSSMNIQEDYDNNMRYKPKSTLFKTKKHRI